MRGDLWDIEPLNCVEHVFL